MFCLKCGQRVPDDSKFCFRCGTTLQPILKVRKGDTSSGQISESTPALSHDVRPSEALQARGIQDRRAAEPVLMQSSGSRELASRQKEVGWLKLAIIGISIIGLSLGIIVSLRHRPASRLTGAQPAVTPPDQVLPAVASAALQKVGHRDTESVPAEVAPSKAARPVPEPRNTPKKASDHQSPIPEAQRPAKQDAHQTLPSKPADLAARERQQPQISLGELANSFTAASPSPGVSTRASSSISTAPPLPTSGHHRAASATTRIKAPYGDFAIWIDPSKWKQIPSEERGILQFNAVDGQGFAKVITERLGIPTDALPEVALTNARNADPNCTLTLQERRRVNDHDLTALQFAATVKGVPLKYYGYYYGGTSGTVQVVTVTTTSSFDRIVDQFTEFLDGLEISDQQLPSSGSQPNRAAADVQGFLTFNNDAMRVTYDQRRWRQAPSGQQGRFQFAHANGDGYAVVIAERIAVPFEALPDIALSNARSADPNAHIVLKEKRNVGNFQVWLLKIETEPHGIPITFLGYYYSGASGTAQILTYTGRTLAAGYEREFMDFLNGFSLTAR